MAQLTERLPPTPEIRGSNLDIGKLLSNICLLSTVLKIKKKEAGNGPFFLKKVLGPVLKISPLATFSFIKVKSHFSDANFELNFSILIHK